MKDSTSPWHILTRWKRSPACNPQTRTWENHNQNEQTWLTDYWSEWELGAGWRGIKAQTFKKQCMASTNSLQTCGTQRRTSLQRNASCFPTKSGRRVEVKLHNRWKQNLLSRCNLQGGVSSKVKGDGDKGRGTGVGLTKWGLEQRKRSWQSIATSNFWHEIYQIW